MARYQPHAPAMSPCSSSREASSRTIGGRTKGLEAFRSSLDQTRRPGRAHRAARCPGGRWPAPRGSPRPTGGAAGQPSTSERTARPCPRCLADTPHRLEQRGRLAVEHEGVSVVGDRERPERRDVERVADVGQAHQLRRPPQRRACHDRQQHQDHAQIRRRLLPIHRNIKHGVGKLRRNTAIRVISVTPLGGLLTHQAVANCSFDNCRRSGHGNQAGSNRRCARRAFPDRFFQDLVSVFVGKISAACHIRDRRTEPAPTKRQGHTMYDRPSRPV